MLRSEFPWKGSWAVHASPLDRSLGTWTKAFAQKRPALLWEMTDLSRTQNSESRESGELSRTPVFLLTSFPKAIYLESTVVTVGQLGLTGIVCVSFINRSVFSVKNSERSYTDQSWANVGYGFDGNFRDGVNTLQRRPYTITSSIVKNR